MNFITFQSRLSDYPVFSLQDVKKACEGFSYRQMDRWEKKGYLKKIRRGFYCLTNHEINEDFLFYTANRIYPPSYVSLEMALKFYNLIPEEVFQITSITTRKTAKFETPAGNFSYRHVKPGLYFGYKIVETGKQRILLAEPEKAVLDYLYMNPGLKTDKDFSETRINDDEFRALIDPIRFQKYLEIFDSKPLSKRANIFLTAIQK